MIYLDTSAFLKLVWEEEGSVELLDRVGHRTDVGSSALLAVEARRGAARSDPTTIPRVDLLLSRLTLVAIGDAVVESASRLPARTLRSLDAIHLATALLLGTDLQEFVTYDTRLADAATAQGIRTVVSPGVA
ncbi:MAG: type II toxin-antitoxin system VapC family toxin [Pseudonocardia sediminis]